MAHSSEPVSTISLAKRVSSSIIAIAITVAAGPYSLNRGSVRGEPSLDRDVAGLTLLGEADLHGLNPPRYQAKPHVLGVGGGDQEAAGCLSIGQDELLGLGEIRPVNEGPEQRRRRPTRPRPKRPTSSGGARGSRTQSRRWRREHRPRPLLPMRPRSAWSSPRRRPSPGGR